MAAAGAVAGAQDFSAVRALYETYCLECHNAKEAKGDFNFEPYLDDQTKFDTSHEMLDHVKWVIEEEEMPPVKAKKQPTDQEREAMFDYAERAFLTLSQAKPNDPGVVAMPRINPDEFDYIVRDLTGHDLQLGQYLTPDGPGKEGFVNFGALQTMSVGQFEGFLSTAKRLLNHAVIQPDGSIYWAPKELPAAGTPQEQVKVLKAYFEEAQNVIQLDVETRHARDLKEMSKHRMAVYLEAAWRYQHRAALGTPNATFAEIAASNEPPLFTSTLVKVWSYVSGQDVPEFKLKATERPLATMLGETWAALPPPGKIEPQEVRKRMDERITELLKYAQVEEFGGASGPLEFEVKDRAEGQERRGFNHRGEYPFNLDLKKAKEGKVYLAVSELWDGSKGDFTQWRKGTFVFKDGSKKPWQQVLKGFKDKDGKDLAFGSHPAGGSAPADTVVIPGGNYAMLDLPKDAVRLEVEAILDPEHRDTTSVQVMPYAEAPKDLMKLGTYRIHGVHRSKAARALDQDLEWLRMFAELKGGVPARIRGNAAFKRLPEELSKTFGFNVPQDSWSSGMPFGLSADDIYNFATEEQKAELDTLAATMKSIHSIQTADESELEKKARAVLTHFSALVWRRGVSPAEIEGLVEIYRKDREEGRSFDASAKTALTAVLMAPDFLYRFNVSKSSTDPYPLNDYELASKLSFALWGTLPDTELRQLAAAGKLQDNAVLNQQIERMLDDPKSDAFIEQFAGLWFGFADFDKFSGPDPERYKQFDEDLKKAMYLEAKLFFKDMLKEGKPITEVFDAGYTYLNERLAEHYGIDGVKGGEMRKVELKSTEQRGGILGMGAFLVKTSTPLRTSPVHRGLWVYEKVFGFPVPEPPPVPTISDEEVSADGLTIPQQLEKHRKDPNCSSCHDRFDPLGVAMENFDAVGAWRTEIADKPVDTKGKFANGKSIDGLEDLREYLGGWRTEYIDNFCEKLLAYSLGRSLLPTDKPALEVMKRQLEADDLSFRTAVKTALFSPQFRNRRDSGVQ